MKLKIAWFGKYFGEEPPISGKRGTGAIFFSGCNLHCVFCQNWQISQNWLGKYYSIEELAKIFLNLEKEGAETIDLVSPTIWWRQIKGAILIAKKEGLKMPIVWNTNATESMEILKELEGLIDVYLPDYKYSDEKLAIKYSKAFNYPKIAKKSILEMQRQVGDLEIDDRGVAKKGLIVRHLILPSNLGNTFGCLDFIRSISENIHLSLMTQYFPLYRAKDFPEINRTLSENEFEKVMEYVERLNFRNGWVQDFLRSPNYLVPDFTKENPFECQTK
jgi:putative pyruvate formate lyase activating enzyme